MLRQPVAVGCCCVLICAVGGMASAQPSPHLGLSPPPRAGAPEVAAYPQGAAIPGLSAIWKFLLGNDGSGRRVSSDDGVRKPERISGLQGVERSVVPVPRTLPPARFAAVIPDASRREDAMDVKLGSVDPVVAVAVLPQGREFDPDESPPEEGLVSATTVAAIDLAVPRPRPGKILRFRSSEDLKVLLEIAKRLPDASSITDHDEWNCLTEAIYFEARGESLRGQVAVAEVILNRRDSPEFPGTVCEVLDQGVQKRGKCQFSYNCDGLHEVFHEKEAHRKAAVIARKMLDGFESNLTNGALYYHSVSVRPGWAKKLTRTAKIGDHYFFNRRDA